MIGLARNHLIQETSPVTPHVVALGGSVRGGVTPPLLGSSELCIVPKVQEQIEIIALQVVIRVMAGGNGDRRRLSRG